MAVCNAATIDLCVTKGETFSQQFQIRSVAGVNVNITGYTITALAKVVVGGSTIVTFTVAIDDAVNGLFTLSLTAVQTAAFDFATLVYDIKFVKIAVPAPRVVTLLNRGPQGAPGTGTLDLGSGITAVNLLSVADTSLYVATADFIPMGFSVRINTVTDFVSVPKVGIKINAGATIFGSGSIFGTDIADEVWVSFPTGMRPLVLNTQQVDFVVGTAGSATVYTADIKLFGVEI